MVSGLLVRAFPVRKRNRPGVPGRSLPKAAKRPKSRGMKALHHRPEFTIGPA